MPFRMSLVMMTPSLETLVTSRSIEWMGTLRKPNAMCLFPHLGLPRCVTDGDLLCPGVTLIMHLAFARQVSGLKGLATVTLRWLLVGACIMPTEPMSAVKLAMLSPCVCLLGTDMFVSLMMIWSFL